MKVPMFPSACQVLTAAHLPLHPPTRPSQDLVGLLLHAQQAAQLPPMAGPPQSSPPPILQQLRHLALIFPPRSVIPPTANLPDCLSTLTQACGLLPACLPVALAASLPLCCRLPVALAASLPLRCRLPAC